MNKWEKISLLATLGLVGLPLLYLILIKFPGHPRPAGAVLLLAAYTGLALAWLQPWHIRLKQPLHRIWPLAAAIIIQILITVAIFSSYLALPDVDPYHWIQVYQQKFLNPDSLSLPQRPLFHALVYLIDLGPITPEQIFKYALPLLSILMLIPAWLVARRFKQPSWQLLALLYPSFSPALIINTQMATPQAIFIIICSFYFYFLIYAELTGQKLWHYAAGALVAASILYYGLAAVLFGLWLTVTLWHSRYRYLIPSVALLIAFAAPYASHYLPLVTSDIRLNLSFPASFITIDGVASGWTGIKGTAKYYAFYPGPLVLTLLSLSLVNLRLPNFRRQLIKLTASPSTLALLLNLLFFLTIAEILPRLVNIAILPERAWLMIALLCPVLLLPLAAISTPKQKAIASIVALGFIAVNIGGALYVNYLKSFSLPDYVVSSARWISANLSPAAAIFTPQSGDYINLYIKQNLKGLPRDALCQTGQLDNLKIKDLPADAYLYYFSPSPRHPYRNRPWFDHELSVCEPIVSDYPEKYQEIYNDMDRAIIWKITD